MPKYRKKPIVIEATEWFKQGDHVNVKDFTLPNNESCNYCNDNKTLHGYIATLEGGHIVCPGDFIITGVHGEHYPCKPDIFEKTYDPVED